MEKVLLISPDDTWIGIAEQTVLSQGFLCEQASNGKDGQLKAYKTHPHYIFLDLNVTEHSGIEVFKYLKNTCHDTKIFLVINGSSVWDDGTLLKMGATKVLHDIDPSTVAQHIRSLGKIAKWQEPNTEPKDTTPLDQEVDITDANFTRILLEDFFEDVIAVTDLFIRIGSNKYVKIVHEGDRTTSEQFKKYAENGAKYIYFRTRDRLKFVSYQNEIAAQANSSSKSASEVVIKATKTAHDKLMEEISASGFSRNFSKKVAPFAATSMKQQSATAT